MTQKLKTVAKLLSFIIKRFFIISNSYIKTTLQIIQQTLAVDDKKLHYIKKKIVTQKEKSSVTGGLPHQLFIDVIIGGAETGKEFLRKGGKKVCIAKK